ncbi:MAG: orotidine-5'-phosphate decarboxylase [Alphaproteobacteria bacterium]|nr:orotidine-5'-phosphate decarboxylase [Alphaproteobacteria bacterium]
MSAALSSKPIAPRERLIFALDTPDIDRAKHLVETLDEHGHFFKGGLELFMADGTSALLGWLGERRKRVFVDLKFFDVPQTVGAAVRQLRGHNAAFATVHGNDAILEAACAAAGDTGILAVTALTSLDRGDLDDLGFDTDVASLVLSRARRALAIGCAGVISSGLEARALREELGHKFLIVVPGIRPVRNLDDQKRTVDVEEAFRNGADYIVVGRPIRDAADPVAAAADIQRRIHALFARA